MEGTDAVTDSKNTFQRVIEEERAKIPSKFQVNKIEFSWESDDRLTYRFTGQQKSTFGFFVLLIGLYFLWVGQPIITLTASTVFFLMYLLFTIPPGRETHTIETEGIRTLGVLYVWADLTEFWFAERDGRIILYVETRLTFPARLILIVESILEAQQITEMLLNIIPYKPLLKPQEYFERAFDGEYVDASTFVEAADINDVLREQAAEQAAIDKAQKATAVQEKSVSKTKANGTDAI